MDRYCRIARRAYFSAAARFAVPGLSREENADLFGSLYSDYGHGHNYVLEAHVIGPVDRATGMVMSMRALDDVLKKVTTLLDHKHLNHDIPRFGDIVPTTENLAAFCHELLSKELAPFSVTLEKVRLYESDEFWVDYGSDVATDLT